MSTARQASFFDRAEMSPAARTVAPVVASIEHGARPDGVRAPSAGEEPCVVCGGAAPFADGASRFCRPHLPKGFMPGTRS